jgi:hypothetical protein
MLLFIVVLIAILLTLSIVVLVEVGLCIGIANLMIYFIPTLDLAATLIPSAILATTLIIVLGGVSKHWIAEGFKTHQPIYEEDDEYEDEEDEPEPPPKTKPRSVKYRAK